MLSAGPRPPRPRRRPACWPPPHPPHPPCRRRRRRSARPPVTAGADGRLARRAPDRRRRGARPGPPVHLDARRPRGPRLRAASPRCQSSCCCSKKTPPPADSDACGGASGGCAVCRGPSRGATLRLPWHLRTCPLPSTAPVPLPLGRPALAGGPAAASTQHAKHCRGSPASALPAALLGAGRSRTRTRCTGAIFCDGSISKCSRDHQTCGQKAKLCSNCAAARLVDSAAGRDNQSVQSVSRRGRRGSKRAVVPSGRKGDSKVVKTSGTKRSITEM